MSDYFTYYAESNIVCTIIFLIMLGHDFLNADKQEKQIKYDHALIAFIGYFVSDICWAAIIAGIIPKNIYTVVFFNFLNYLLMAAITYTWLRFVMAVEQVPNRERLSNRFAVLFPFLLTTLILFLTYFVSPEVLISENLNITPVYFVFEILVPIIYIVAVLIYTVRKSITEENIFEKRNHLFIGFFPITVVIGGVIQIILFNNKTPVFCFCSTILMLVFYIKSMDNQISIDPLTKLNNRGQLLRYISQKSNLRIEGRPTYIIMIDVNDFKKINDTIGHGEGDRALRIVADSLKEAASGYNMPSFMGRYGGDEFIVIAHPMITNELKEFMDEIRSTIEEKCRSNNTPYILSVGIGCDELMRGQDSFHKCLQRADHKMYLDKEYCKMNGKSTKFI